MKTKSILPLMIVLVVNTALYSQSDESFTDTRDGQTYETVRIGEQIWMAENLNYDTASGCWCYNDSISNCNQCGRLYTWQIAKNVCPNGWHLPSKNEFEILLDNVGGSGSKAYFAFIDADSIGFKAFPCGWRLENGNFCGLTHFSMWWSSTDSNSGYPNQLSLNSSNKYAYIGSSNKEEGLSVRCLKD
jgi:uncharacterized protein (TIGR02145 family)